MKLEDVELIARHRLTTWTKMWLIVFTVHSTHKNKKKKDREIERKKKEGPPYLFDNIYSLFLL